MASDEKFDKELAASIIILDDIKEALESGEKEDIEHGYKRICDVINKLESAKDQTTEAMLSEEKAIEEVREWNKKQKKEMEQFRELRKRLKQVTDELIEKEKENKQAAELEHQRQLRHEQALIDEERNKQLEESKLRDQQRKEEWYKKKLEMELEMARKKTEEMQVRPQSVKLQKYTITPFKGDY